MTDLSEQANEMQPEREWAANDPVRIEAVTGGYDAGYRQALADVRAGLSAGTGWIRLLNELSDRAGA